MVFSPPVVRGRFVPGRTKKPAGKLLSAHMKYLEHRKRDEHEQPEDRSLFNQERDQIDRKEAVSDVMSHTSQKVSYHKIVFSPAEYEHVDDFRQWVREQMSDLQEHKGVVLHWYGVVHANERENTSEPHVHVVVAGAGEDLQTGETRTMRMDAPDYAFLRQQGREHSNFEFYHALENELHDLNRLDAIGQEQPEREREGRER